MACSAIRTRHSHHDPSQTSAADLELARAPTLAFFDADPAVYDVCFTANTSAAIKPVAESYPFGPNRGLILSADNHNSMNGIREYARAAGTTICVVPLDADLGMSQPVQRLMRLSKTHASGGLFGFPAQPNFSGVKHSLELIGEAQRLGYDVLLDAAGVGCGGRISLRPPRRVPGVLFLYTLRTAHGPRRTRGASRCARTARAAVVRRRDRRLRIDRT